MYAGYLEIMHFVNIKSLLSASDAILACVQYRLLLSTVHVRHKAHSVLCIPYKEEKDDSSARRNLSSRAAKSDSYAGRSEQHSFLSLLPIACVSPAMALRRTEESYSPPGDALLQKRYLSLVFFHINYAALFFFHRNMLCISPVYQRKKPLFSVKEAFLKRRFRRPRGFSHNRRFLKRNKLKTNIRHAPPGYPLLSATNASGEAPFA